jgi:exosome complex component RRP42
MAPYTNLPLSPAELSYLHTSLSQNPPLRPDGRSPAQFRPLIAETDILPSANGSARICFADGTEAVVGVKAEVEKTKGAAEEGAVDEDVDMEGESEDDGDAKGRGEDSWLQLAIEIPGMRDDDPLPIFLSAMLTEASLADGELKEKLWINRRFHWRLYVDVSGES